MEGYKTLEETAKILGMTKPGVIWNIKETGQLKADRIGKIYIIEEKEIERFRKSRENIQDGRYKIF